MAEIIALDDPETPVVLRRSARARRITLSVPGAGDPPRVTVPRGVSDSEVRMFLMRQADWLRAALARAPEAVLVRYGARLPVGGTYLTVTQREGPRRPPFVHGEALVVTGTGAPGPRVAAWLKESARAALSPIARAAAAEFGRNVGQIAMRDTKGRWGSCSSKGNLNFSWRLAMAPPEVLDYVAVHEAAHLREMNHGPKFWALVEAARPDWRRQRDWLKREGAALQRYRFDAGT